MYEAAASRVPKQSIVRYSGVRPTKPRRAPRRIGRRVAASFGLARMKKRRFLRCRRAERSKRQRLHFLARRRRSLDERTRRGNSWRFQRRRAAAADDRAQGAHLGRPREALAAHLLPRAGSHLRSARSAHRPEPQLGQAGADDARGARAIEGPALAFQLEKPQPRGDEGHLRRQTRRRRPSAALGLGAALAARISLRLREILCLATTFLRGRRPPHVWNGRRVQPLHSNRDDVGATKIPSRASAERRFVERGAIDETGLSAGAAHVSHASIDGV